MQDLEGQQSDGLFGLGFDMYFNSTEQNVYEEKFNYTFHKSYIETLYDMKKIEKPVFSF